MKFVDRKAIKNNFYTTEYFLKTREILKKNRVKNISTMQWKTNNRIPYIACGCYEILEILKSSIPKNKLKNMIIKYAPDGTIIDDDECVFSITGNYIDFCHIENLIDGILARRCSVATNCASILSLVDSNKIVFMSDRSDDYRLQPYDGYAAYQVGIRNFSNFSHVSLIENKDDVFIFSSMPHALIQQFNGDIVKTFHAYKKHPKFDGIILIDFNNDVIGELEELVPYFDEIKGVRLDTSIDMIDLSLQVANIDLPGVNHVLVKMVREFLDANNGKHIKIIVSSNNNYDTIKELVKHKAKIDYFGIGSYLTHLSLHFTADLVTLNNKNFSKFGREKLSERKLIKWNDFDNDFNEKISNEL